MGTIFIPEDYGYFNATGANSREIVSIKDAAPKHPGTVYVYVLGKASESHLSVGKTVFVKSPSYSFSANVWYIYQGSAGYNLYLKTAYVGGDFSGVVSTEQINETSKGDNLITGQGTPVGDGKGTGTPTAAPSVVNETIAKATGGNQKFVYLGIVAVVALFLWKKFGKKGKKK